jgi:hypothetical protein
LPSRRIKKKNEHDEEIDDEKERILQHTADLGCKARRNWLKPLMRIPFTSTSARKGRFNSRSSIGVANLLHASVSLPA